MSSPTLPIGIRNLNPGNLRQAYSMPYPTKLNEGFAVFNTMLDGVEALAHLVADYYQHYNCHTLNAFVMRYAPASENDVAMYITTVSTYLHIPFNSAGVRDLRLDVAWNAMDVMRGIIHIENGPVSSEWISQTEWISPSLMMAGMQKSERWSVL